MQNEAGDDPAIRRLILAPLRGVTHLSFRRCLMKHFGGLDGAVSPFLTTVAGSKIKATHLADILPEANAFLPLVPQIIGKDPVQFRTLLLAVRDLGYTRCDLNIGCPWPLIVKKGRGAGLLRDPDNLRRMLDAGCDVLGEGLSVKVRLGIDRPGLLLERMEIFNSYPLAEMTIHARTAAQRYEGEVDLDGFAACLAAAKAPVVYNGDIRAAGDVRRLAARFPGVAGFMVGRGLVTDPALALRVRHDCAPGGGQAVPPASWRAYEPFVRDYGETTRAELFGPASFLGRMKEFWSYHHAAYPRAEELWRRIRTCRSYADYDAIVDSLYRGGPAEAREGAGNFRRLVFGLRLSAKLERIEDDVWERTMAYEVLARKWRPRQMADVIGQEHVTRTLQHAIESGRVAHAYLFVGPRGIGKTTLSRIFAKALDCEHGPTPTPCDECDLCREIMAGNALDVIEIDAASNNGVDNIRDIRDSIQFAPARARYKIYIVDEVHMLSTGAFNALLKTLEEPPPYVKFIFATTEIDKLPATIISRCQRFDLRRIPTTLIVEHLRRIAGEEGVKADGDALLAIARGAEGGMRDALGALDQIISFKGNDVTEQDVLAVFGLVSRTQLEELAAAILKGDMAAGLRIIDDLDRKGKDLRRLAVELMEHFRNLLVRQQLGADAAQALDVTPEQLAALDAQAKLADSARLLRITEHLADLESRMRTALSRRTIFETVFLRCCRAATVVSLDQVIKQLAQLKDGAAATAGGPPAPASPAPAAGGPGVVPASPRPAAPAGVVPASPRPAAPAGVVPDKAGPSPTRGPSAATSPTRPALPPRPPAPQPVVPPRPPLRGRPVVPPRPPAPAPAPQPAVQAPTQKPPPDKAILDNPVVKTAVELFHGSVADVIRPVPADAN